MCADPRGCVGDYCCKQTVEECEPFGGERVPSVTLDLELPEWRGRATPEMLRKWATTTTLDAYQEFLQNAPTTTLPGSFAEEMKEELNIALIIGGIVGAVLICCSCYAMGFINVKNVRNVLMGPARLLTIYHTDPVSVFVPTGNLPRDKKREAPLPPARTKAELEEERRDNEACAALEDAWTAAILRGSRHLVRFAGQDEPPEAARLRHATALVRSRGLEGKGKNMEYIQNAEKWLGVLDAEYLLVNATEEARPDLRWTAQTRNTQAPVKTVPWHATTMGRIAEGEVRKEGWKHIEELRSAIQEASQHDISEVILYQARQLLTELIARTPELPADRCVLDPEGEGIKLLPKGQHRAVWTLSGDAYNYDSTVHIAGNLGEDSPPKELLGDVNTDESRPVCAEWAKSQTCRAGRNCPWRHVRPKAGDSIRECIIFEEA